MKHIKFGDILSAKDGIIVHGCNAQGVMGSGLALQIKNRWPECYTFYTEELKKAKDSNTQLLGSIYPFKTSRGIIIANCVTQINFGKVSKQYVSYEAIYSCFKILGIAASEKGVMIHYPMIGAGLGGGNWSIISEIIDSALDLSPNVERTLWVVDNFQ